MSPPFYSYWKYGSLPLALVSATGFYICFGINSLDFLIWINLSLFFLHQAEEYIYPGTFRQYMNRIVFSSGVEVPLTEIRSCILNVGIIWISLSLAGIGAGFWTPLALTLPWAGIINSITHIGATILRKRYMPGLITSLAQTAVGILSVIKISRTIEEPVFWNGSASGLVALIHIGIYFYLRAHRRGLLK